MPRNENRTAGPVGRRRLEGTAFDVEDESERIAARLKHCLVSAGSHGQLEITATAGGVRPGAPQVSGPLSADHRFGCGGNLPVEDRMLQRHHPSLGDSDASSSRVPDGLDRGQGGGGISQGSPTDRYRGIAGNRVRMDPRLAQAVRVATPETRAAPGQPPPAGGAGREWGDERGGSVRPVTGEAGQFGNGHEVPPHDLRRRDRPARRGVRPFPMGNALPDQRIPKQRPELGRTGLVGMFGIDPAADTENATVPDGVFPGDDP